MKNLAGFSVNRPVTVTMLILIVVVLGILSLTKLGLDMLPEIDYPVISVVVQYPGVNSKDVEKLVTEPLEEAVSTVSNIKSIHSTSQEGLSIVLVELNWGTNLDFAAQDIREKVGLIEDYLPDDSSKPLVVKFDVSSMPVLAYGITFDCLGNCLNQDKDKTAFELRRLLKDEVKERIEKLEGIASVSLMGGLEKEVQINLIKSRLEAYGISQDQVFQALRAENLNISGGRLEQGDKEFSVRTIGEYQNIKEIGQTVVAILNNQPVYLRDIAEIKDSYQEERGYSRTNNQPSVLLMVNKQSGTNTTRVAERAKKEIESIAMSLPQLRFHLVMDQSKFVRVFTNRLIQSAIIGAFLASLIIFFFLRNWRPASIIIVAIPLSVIAAFIPIYGAGYTLNLMTLGGLALGVGMLVDNAVVVIENIFRHLEKGESKKQAAVKGTSEVTMAIVASTLTTVAVFFPMALAGGLAGQLSRGFALTIASSLFASLFISLTLAPMLASRLFSQEISNHYFRSTQNKFQKLKERYRKILRWCLSHRRQTIIFSGMIFLFSLLLIPFIGTSFFPSIDSDMLVLNIRMPAGTSLETTDRLVSQIEDVILGFDDVDSESSFVGLYQGSELDVASGMTSVGVNEAQIMIALKDKNKRHFSSQELSEMIRKKLPAVKGGDIRFTDVSNIGGLQSPVEIKIFGKDLAELKKISDNIASDISQIEGIRDIETTFSEGSPEFQIKIDKTKASHLGLTAGQIGSAVRDAWQGRVATRIRQKGEEINIRVRYQQIDRETLSQLGDIQIASPLGISVPLRQIGDVVQGEGPVKITREDQMRFVSITANSAGRDLGSIVQDIKNRIKTIYLPSGYFIKYGGSYKQMQETFKDFGFALLMAILLVYMVMAAQFENLIHPLVIMFTMPLALVGVLLALALSGQDLSAPSFMGLIVLTGIVVNNAIVLIDYVNQLRKQGLSRHLALVEGGVVRLRPILITSLTTILAMLPVALNSGLGAERMRPMAVAVIGGLTVATGLTLLVIPVIYSLSEDLLKKILLKISVNTKEKGKYQ